MKQLHQPERSALTREGVIDDLVARLTARRALTTRSRAAYQRLTRTILDEATPVWLADARVEHTAGLASAA
jgi:hypothetical protein